MKNNKIAGLIIALLVIICTFPVFADDQTGSAEEVEDAVAASDASASERGDLYGEDAGGINAADAEEVTAAAGVAEGAADPKESYASDATEVAGTIEGAEMKDAANGPDETAGFILTTEGSGTLSVTERGTVVCAPAEGWEVTSITADRDAGDIKAGAQIPEAGLSALSFEAGTEISAVFERTAEGNTGSRAPASATAIFG